jgi:DNA polymerase III epsilon subunit-like protein
MSAKHNIMLDLETLSTAPNCVIVSIGAVKFDAKEIDNDGFYAVLNLQEQIDKGRHVSGSTIQWWMKQSAEARAVFDVKATYVEGILNEFAEWVGRDPIIWGNGSDFDNVALGSLYDAYNMTRPWGYSSGRCFRTMKNLMQVTEIPGRTGTFHNALHDALYQAQCLQVYLKGKVKL